jgi:hypothetical protein
MKGTKKRNKRESEKEEEVNIRAQCNGDFPSKSTAFTFADFLLIKNVATFCDVT